MKKYAIIHADPPWQFDNVANSAGQWGGAAAHYGTLSIAELCLLPVGDLAAKNCLLALWHVPAMPREALRVVEAWGFRLITMKGFSWQKITKTGKLHFGMGTLTRGGSEDCLFAVRGKPRRRSASVRSTIVAPVLAHSAKPEEARRRLVELLGDVPRIELFARGRHAGWHVWGDQVRSDVRLKSEKRKIGKH